ncbi:hypothetical protein FBQ97_03370 [Acidobacteria bacterium ACD]|nr:hypothetical protein [Acidobacteria bacterium ACD]
MYELLTLLQQVPRPIKYLAVVGLLMPVTYALIRGLGLQKYWWVVIGGMILIAVAVWAFEKLVRGRDKAKGKDFAGDLEKDSQKVGASKQEVRAALKDLADQWSGALKSLQATGLNIYSLPWYLLIGEPQSGKSTTLKNSGLEFPVGNEGLSGSGGTRNCDWWFANEAVILDTAGRFTFNEEAAPDQAEWSTFLRLLKKHRRYCPINGVLVVVPCTSLLEDAPEEMDRKAANIRTKLLHLQRVLEIRFPVFIMVTKADRILGFSEFFSKLDPVDQRQLFGWSNPASADKPWDPNAFDGSFEDVVTRVHKLRLKFSATDENVQNVDRLFVFPDELRALKEPLKRYLGAIFQQTRYDEPFHFRGYYVSSGVQQGKPIARATRELLGSAGEGIVENLESIFKRSRAFFIKDFYEKKVFPEQGLIAKTRAAEKLERQTLWLVRGLSAALILLVLCGMIPAYIGLKRIVEPIRVTVRNTQECMEDKPQPCTLPKAYRSSKELYGHRIELTKHPFLFAMFLPGKRAALDDVLMRIEQKVYLARVVTPVMKDFEARAGAMSWETYTEAQQYFDFREALLNHLRWSYLKNVTSHEPGVKPATVPKELKVSPFIVFARDTKGLPASPKSKEVDDWVKALGDDPAPDQILLQVLPGSMPANGEWWEVPDLGKPVKKFEEYWTVENLARWDFRLWTLLQRYAQAYSATLQIEDPTSVSYLSRVSTAGKDFKAAWEETTKHLGTLRPGSKEFPGFTVEDWQAKLDEDYQKLILYEAAAPTLVNDNRLQALKTNLATEKRNLDARLGSYAYLVEPDPAALGQKMKWTKPAEGISPMVAELVVFSDLEAFKAAVLPEKIVADALAKSAAKDQEAGLEAFRMQQEETKKKAVANVVLIPSIPPEHVASWQVPLLQRFVATTGDLALVYRVVPSALDFLKKSIAPGGLPENVIFQPLYAKAIVPLGVRFMSFTEGSSALAGRQDVEQLVGELAEVELDYLRRYIDRTQAPRPRGGGGGFGVPYGALQARSWSEFQGVITRWNPEGGGGDSGPAPVDMSGALTWDDVQAFGNSSRRLNPIIKYFQDRMQPVKRPSGGGAKAPPEVVQAAQTFKQTVTALSDQPLKAWKQLSLAQEGTSLRAYHSFSRSAAVRRSPWGRQLVSVENRGANLVRDAIRPNFSQVQEPVWRKLQSTCQGQFPFISGRQLANDRQAYSSLTSLRFSGGGSNVSYNLDLPSIGQTQFSGILTELGALCDEYALDPILWGGEPEFDFVGDPQRSWFHVGRRWERWVYGGPGGGGAAGGQLREHKVDIRPIQFNPLPGRRFVGDRVGAVILFDRNTMVRPSTDAKAGRFAPNPFVWRLSPAEAPMPILGRNEESGTRGWTGNLDVKGGPLRFYYLVRVASEPRDRLAFESDEEKMREKEKYWTIRLVFPNAETVNEPLEGLFELVFDEPVPPILGN